MPSIQSWAKFPDETVDQKMGVDFQRDAFKNLISY